MEAGLLSLAARRLIEMGESDADNEIARLRPDELTSLCDTASRRSERGSNLKKMSMKV